MNADNNMNDLKNKITEVKNEASRLKTEAELKGLDDQADHFRDVWDALDDLEYEIFQQQFIDNNAKIQALINKISQPTQKAQKVNQGLGKIKLTVVHLRQKLQQVNAYIDDAKNLVAEVDDLVELINTP